MNGSQQSTFTQGASWGTASDRRRAWPSLLLFCGILGVPLAWLTWHWLGPGPEPEVSGIGIANQRELTLLTGCANNLEVDVVEHPDEIRIDDLRGDVIDGDCANALAVPLAEPIAGKTIVVDGAPWVRVVGPRCRLGDVVPPDDVKDSGPCSAAA